MASRFWWFHWKRKHFNKLSFEKTSSINFISLNKLTQIKFKAEKVRGKHPEAKRRACLVIPTKIHFNHWYERNRYRIEWRTLWSPLLSYHVPQIYCARGLNSLFFSFFFYASIGFFTRHFQCNAIANIPQRKLSKWWNILTKRIGQKLAHTPKGEAIWTIMDKHWNPLKVLESQKPFAYFATRINALRHTHIGSNNQ